MRSPWTARSSRGRWPRRAAVTPALLLAFAALALACGSQSDNPSDQSGVPQGVFQAIDEHIRNSGLNGATAGAALAGDCMALGVQVAICIDSEASTVLADEATVRLYDSYSETGWDISLVRRSEGWLVTNVADLGPP